MKRLLAGTGLVLLVAGPVAAQEPAPVYQAEEQYSFKLKLEGLVRQEFTDPGFLVEDDRALVRLLPRVEVTFKKLMLVVGGDFIHGTDRNTEVPAGLQVRPLIRDNYRSREARLDLAFASLRPSRWLRLVSGRFEMPMDLTEMTWDRDLRPQGGALTLEARDLPGVRSLGLTALAAQGSHVFDDDRTNMFAAAATADLAPGARYRIQVQGAFLKFTQFSGMEPLIRRQNSRIAGRFVHDYEVFDVVARLRWEGKVSAQLVGDYCRNTAVDEGGEGLWLALVLGSTRTARVRGEYNYALVDPDATLAAYATDDFLWATGWEGHRGDLGVRILDRVAFHAVGQAQRFKDSPRAEERDDWLKRLRLELRFDLGR